MRSIVDTIVQWIRLHASGFIASVNRIDISRRGDRKTQRTTIRQVKDEFTTRIQLAAPRYATLAQRGLRRAGIESTPSWFIYGSRDLNIPEAAHSFMAKRASSKKTVVVKGASHVVMVSHPGPIARLIEDAAAAN